MYKMDTCFKTEIIDTYIGDESVGRVIIDGALWCRIDPGRSLRGAQRGCRLFSKLPWIQLDNRSVKLVAKGSLGSVFRPT